MIKKTIGIAAATLLTAQILLNKISCFKLNDIEKTLQKILGFNQKVDLVTQDALNSYLLKNLADVRVVKYTHMEDIKSTLSDLIKKFVSKRELTGLGDVKLAVPEEQHGDFMTNAVLVFAKRSNKNPIELANKIKKALMEDDQIMKMVASIDVAGPGFINFTLRHDTLIEELKKIISQKNYGYSKIHEGKKAIVDYSSPNIAKQFSFAHLRSTIVGQAAYNLLKSQGYDVIGVNHLGDWGTQFGKLIVAIERWSSKPVSDLTFDELERLYVHFHKMAEEDASLIIEAREAFNNLEKGRKKEKDIWKWLVTISLDKFDEIYKLLGVKIDFVIGESFYLDKLEEVINDAKTKNILEESQGALIVKFDDEKISPALLRKSDGASTYCLRDLAAIKYRKDRWNPNLFIYEVGDEQKLHFDQVFKVAAKLEYGNLNQFVHLAHGEIRTPAGRMSTRKGNVVRVSEILNRLIEKAKKISPDKETATRIGVCALKFNDLKRAPASQYSFNWKEILSLDGCTGPYLQYAYVRASKVLEKSKIKNYDLTAKIQLNTDELRLARKLIQFPYVVLEAAERLYPPVLCSYLYNLSQLFNIFYDKNAILKANSKKQKGVRLGLTQATRKILESGMTILGLPTVKQM